MIFYQRKPDIIIRNGKVVDGTGKPAFYADIAIKGDRIDYIGNLDGVSAPLEIDAHHKYVTPGFIDSHTHSDGRIWRYPDAQNAVRQGVTTEVLGNCGFLNVRRDTQGNYYKGCVAALLDDMDKTGASINTVWLCGHNRLRQMAGITTVDPSDEQFNIMAEYLREAMEAGYKGFSTGLEFVPGNISRPEEVERLAAIAAEYDANYSTHMRDEGTYILEAINEFLNVIRKTGMRGTVSHLNVKYDNGIPNEYLQRGMQMLKDARDIEHLNVYCDMLPTTFATGGALALLPPWLYADGWDKAREIMSTPEGRAKIKADFCRYWRFLDYGQWDRLLYIYSPFVPETLTRPFNELAKEAGMSPFDYFIHVMAQAPNIESASPSIQGTVFNEQILVDSVVTDPIYMWQTDSSVTSVVGEGKPGNVQDYMSMTYFFTRYVRDLGAIPIEKALTKVSSIPASHFKLEDRGVLAEGYYADINVFDLNELKIHSTFTDPCEYSTGMYYVIVNGTPVIAKGDHTGALSGRALRHLPRK